MYQVFFIIFISYNILSFTLHAQIDSSAQIKSLFAKGTKAVLFQISNNFTLRSFEGGMISFKRHFSEKNALRIGFSFSGNHDEEKQHWISTPVDSLEERYKTVQSYVSAGLYSTYIRYLKSNRNIKSYFGLGLYVLFDHNYYEYSSSDRSPGENKWTIGPQGSFGVEWFPHNSISLNAEYSCSGRISFGKSYKGYYIEEPTIFKIKKKSWGYGFGQQSVRFGVAVYL